MTREEEKKKARWEYVNKRLANPDFPTYNAEYELEAAFDKGAEWADRTMIDKACEWLKDYAYMFVSETTGDLYEDDLINDFRKDMKGEQDET